MYEYKATVLKWTDGDSVTLSVDLGFRIQTEMKFRLAGIDTPETNSPDDELRARAMRAKARVNEYLPVGSICVIHSEKPFAQEKWGRWLAWVFAVLPGGAKLPLSINEMLVNEGLAKTYEGGAR